MEVEDAAIYFGHTSIRHFLVVAFKRTLAAAFAAVHLIRAFSQRIVFPPCRVVQVSNACITLTRLRKPTTSSSTICAPRSRICASFSPSRCRRVKLTRPPPTGALLNGSFFLQRNLHLHRRSPTHLVVLMHAQREHGHAGPLEAKH